MAVSNLDRRQFIRFNAAAIAGAALVPAVTVARDFASEPVIATDARGAPANFYRFSVGDLDVIVLRDGQFPVSAIAPPGSGPDESLAGNADGETRAAYFAPHLDRDGDLHLRVSPVLLDSGDQRVLVDSGSPPEEMATSGHLLSALELAGVSPASVDVVILTHAHPDHLGGLLHPTTREPVFPNAEVVLADTEFEFWTGDEAAPVLEIPMLAGIPDILKTLDDQLRLIRMGDEVVSGITSIPSPGHSPGHISLGVETGEQELLLTGDAIVTVHASFEHPEWQPFFDLEPDQASRSRRRLLDRAVNHDMLILGYHFPFPGVGYAVEDGDGFRWYPAG